MGELRKPCQKCPFARQSTPGAMGGSDPMVFIGQAYGPYRLNCHMAEGYEQDPDCMSAQCAGAAIFRANVDRAKLMPAVLLALPKDTETVFADAAELLAHHSRRSLPMARAFLDIVTPEELMRAELRKVAAGQGKLHFVPKGKADA